MPSTHYGTNTSISRSWNSFGFDPATLVTLRNTIESAVGVGNVFFKTASGNGSIIFKIPNTNFFFRLYLADNDCALYIGTSAVNGQATLVNELLIAKPYGSPFTNASITPRNARTFLYVSEMGFLIGSVVDSTTATESDIPNANAYHLAHFHGASLLVNESSGLIDTDKVLTWSGQWAKGSNGSTGGVQAYRRGEWLSAYVYTRSGSSLGNPAVQALPFIGVAPFARSQTSQPDQLYGVKTYAPLPPYWETMLFRRFPKDTYQEGDIVQVGTESYWLNNWTNSAFWLGLENALPFLTLGGNGILALHWE